MTKIIYLPRSEKELEEIYDYILSYSHSIRVAVTTHNSILDAIDRLASFSQIGQIEQDISEADIIFRSLVVLKNYKVFYFIKNEIVFIFSIWDCRRNPKELNM